MAKSKSRQIVRKLKTAVTLSPESLRRLGAASLVEGMSQSEIVELLIDRNLSRYSVSLRGEGLRDSTGGATTLNLVPDTDRHSSADHVSETAALAA